MKKWPFIVGLFLLGCSAHKSQYYSLDDYCKVAKSDVHVHIHTDRDFFVTRAQEDNFRLLTIALDSKNSFEVVLQQHRYCVGQMRRHPDMVQFATAFSMEGWDNPDWQEKTMAWLDTAIDDGAIAVKIWKNIGMVFRDKEGKLIRIDDDRFDPIFHMLTERKIPVIGHLGEPKNCWLPLNEMTTNNDSVYYHEHPEYHMYKHPDLPSYEDQIAARDHMLEKNPDLIFIGAHLGSLEWDVDELTKRLDRFPNMVVDMAARMGQLFYQTHYDRKKVRDFFIKYQDRLLYATDLGDYGQSTKEQLQKQMHDTWYRDWQYLVSDDQMTSDLVDESFQGLKLPKAVIDKIYLKNAQKWFGIFKD